MDRGRANLASLVLIGLLGGRFVASSSLVGIAKGLPVDRFLSVTTCNARKG